MRKQERIDAILCKNLKRLVAESNLKQGEFARIVGKERKTINHWLNGINQPNSSDVILICLHFGISADELLGLDGRKRR